MLQTVTFFGKTVELYGFFNNLALLGQLVIFLVFRARFKATSVLPELAELRLNKKKKDTVFWRWWPTVLLCVVILAGTMLVNSLTGSLVSQVFLHNTDDNFFPNIFFNFITIFALSVLMRCEPLSMLDLAAPLTAVALVFYKIACFCQGCCYGVECASGMFNQDTNRVEFPVQLVEAGCAAVMLAVLLILLKKKKHKNGVLFPLFMLMYCGSRFVSEFWRGDYPAILGKMTAYHVQCIVGFVEGLVFLVLVLVFGGRISAFFEKKNEALLAKHQGAVDARKQKRHPKKKK